MKLRNEQHRGDTGASSQQGSATLTWAFGAMAVTLVLAVGAVSLQGYSTQHINDSNMQVGTTYDARNALTRVHAATVYDTSGTVTSGLSANTWSATAPSPAPSATAGTSTAYSAAVNGCKVSIATTRSRSSSSMTICAQAVALPPGSLIDGTQ